MDSSGEIRHDFRPFFRVHKTGLIQRCIQHDFKPPSHDPQTGVVSRDVIISPENNISGRLYLPNKADKKLPLIIYFHGGAFSVESAYSSTYHPYQNTLSSTSASLVFSIEYRLAPEHPIPTCYDDSWDAVKWVESHYQTDPWINEFVDFNRVYFAGDSAGANIAHNMAIRAGSKDLEGFGLRVSGLVLIHPFFGIEGGPNMLWDYICGSSGGGGDNEMKLNPGVDMDTLSNLGCERVLVYVAEKDFLRERGLKYYETLRKSEWKGEIEVFETFGKDHVFHLREQSSDEALLLLNRLVFFINNQPN